MTLVRHVRRLAHPRRPVRVAAGALVCGLLLAGCSSFEGTGSKGYISGTGQITQVALNQRESPIELSGTDLDGRPVDLADYRGKPVVVSVWGSWCVECVQEAPTVTEAANELAGEAKFVGIDIRDPAQAQAQAYVRRFATPFPSIYSQGGEALLAFPGVLGPNSVPAFVVLDPEGRVAASVLGQLPSKLTLADLVADAAKTGPGTVDG